MKLLILSLLLISCKNEDKVSQKIIKTTKETTIINKMSFFEELIIDLGRDGIYYFIKRLGMLTKWFFYSGKKPLSVIKNENWNTRIGFILFLIIVGIIIYIVN